MEQHALPQNGVAWRTERGCIGIWLPCPQIMVLSLLGYGEADFAIPILEAYEELSKAERFHFFADAEQLVNYDSRLRTAMTARFLPDRKRFETLHVMLKSKIVAMGVSVANLALGGIVNVSNDPEPFKAALDACLFKNHVVGFSSNALQAPRFQSMAAPA